MGEEVGDFEIVIVDVGERNVVLVLVLVIFVVVVVVVVVVLLFFFFVFVFTLLGGGGRFLTGIFTSIDKFWYLLVILVLFLGILPFFYLLLFIADRFSLFWLSPRYFL
jgi:hypothetical protein